VTPLSVLSFVTVTAAQTTTTACCDDGFGPAFGQTLLVLAIVGLLVVAVLLYLLVGVVASE
jgi:hypothetical protein